MTRSRREFLRSMGCTALTSAAFAAGFERFGLVSAYASGIGTTAVADYKALVCIFLAGGNDGNNTVIPNDSYYSDYSAARPTSGIGIAQGLLLPVTPPGTSGRLFGLHPNLTDLHTLWGQQRLAVVCNAGPLVEPTTRTTYQNGTARRPYQLFSHSDQQQCFQTPRSDTRLQTGWGGLVADLTVGLNAGNIFPMVTSVAGTNLFSQGAVTRPLGIAPAPASLLNVLNLNCTGTTADCSARRTSMNYLRTIDRAPVLVRAAGDAMQQALDVDTALDTDPTLTTVFPNTTLGNQLRQVAKVIKLNDTGPQMGLKRQIFFCSLGGFDTHQNQRTAQDALLTQLSQAMKAFYDATVELGVSSTVTTFTLSDFSRTLQPSGNGTDHAWGNHLFVMGDGVKGGDFYGVPGVDGSIYPSLKLGNAAGSYDTDTRGRWVPTVAVEQYAATLALWFGVTPASIATIFPLIGRFTTADLGFML